MKRESIYNSLSPIGLEVINRFSDTIKRKYYANPKELTAFKKYVSENFDDLTPDDYRHPHDFILHSNRECNGHLHPNSAEYLNYYIFPEEPFYIVEFLNPFENVGLTVLVSLSSGKFVFESSWGCGVVDIPSGFMPKATKFIGELRNLAYETKIPAGVVSIKVYQDTFDGGNYSFERGILDYAGKESYHQYTKG